MMISPFILPPPAVAQEAAAEVIEKVHAYMRMHPESELHRQGKMFGVLVYQGERVSGLVEERYLAAFSAKLDGTYYHEGFVPPAFSIDHESSAMDISPVGHNKGESQRLQRLLFAQYSLLNGEGKVKNLLDIFANEKPILSKEEFFSKGERLKVKGESLPPSGAGDCCAPKLLQYAFRQGLRPVALAEFWVGAPSKTEIKQEGVFYAPCSGRCVPILRHMLQGVEMVKMPDTQRVENLCAQIAVLYEDEWLMVVNKPAGLLSVPGKGEEKSVEEYLQAKAVHRLDQDTSGLLVLAKTPEVYKTLQAYFQRRDILKRYEAVVKPSAISFQLSDEGTIDLPLLPNPYDRPRQMVDYEHGKPAITRYEVRERREDGTVLVDFYPLTGRTHQLRVHAAHPDGLNAPIVGDRLYNSQFLSPKGNDYFTIHNSQLPERLMLHAAEIRFQHPVTKKEMHFCIPFTI